MTKRDFSLQSRFNKFDFTKQSVNSRNVTPDYKIVNAVTGIQYDSLKDQKKWDALKEQGISKEELDFKNDPYLKLLEGLKLMDEFFRTSTYHIITTPSAVASLDEIKRGFYSEDKTEVNIDGETYYYDMNIRISVPLLEMIRIIALGGNVSLVDKSDAKRLHDELGLTIKMADPENKLSYNRLPSDPIVVQKMIDLKKHLEEKESWIFYVPTTPAVNIVGQAMGDLYDILSGLNDYSEKNKTKEDINVSHLHRYVRRS